MPTVAQHFLSPEDLADYLGVPVATVYGWRYKGLAGCSEFGQGRVSGRAGWSGRVGG